MVPHIRSHRAPCSCFPKKVSLQLSSEQSVRDVRITQLDWKRVPRARSRGCRSSVAITAECVHYPGDASGWPSLVTRSMDGCHFELVWYTATACAVGRQNGDDCRVRYPAMGKTLISTAFRALVLLHCWLGVRKSVQPVKNWVVRCWCGYLSGARCKLAYGPADATATHCLLLQ